MNDVISNTFERHAQTALVLLLVALLVWVGKTTQTTAVAIAKMEVEIKFLRDESAKPHNHGDLSGEMAAIRQQIEDHIKKCEASRGTG